MNAVQGERAQIESARNGTVRNERVSNERAQGELAAQIRRRRTFAIISHPDAGKTTLTEKLLLYGGAIRLAGSVKARRAARYATSDWMELERQRGISITSTVLQFPYNGFQINLLDTPGHQDFSEDTYRTLTAADSAVMLIDAAKGVEPQTIKLFEVCRMRGIPIFTFINKLDRHGKDPFALLEEIERVLGIGSHPMNWPIGMGRDFRGVFNRRTGLLELFEGVGHGELAARRETRGVDDPELTAILGEQAHRRLQEEIALLDVAGDPFDPERVQEGELTPVFFGSALNNFGVQTFLEAFLEMAPPPAPKPSDKGEVAPEEPRFSGFVFKIQANMNPAHRDRIAFVRICSGRFERGMSVWHTRLGREVRLAQPQQFLAQERNIVEEAYAGDIIGVFDPGIFRIGDALCQGEPVQFQGIPQFSPELFAVAQLKDAMKRKSFRKGLEELAEEGAIQVFERPDEPASPEAILGAVGQLQFDVFLYRLEHEYGAQVELRRLPYQLARWVLGEGFDPAAFQRVDSTVLVDRKGRPVVLFESEWALMRARERHPKLQFVAVEPA